MRVSLLRDEISCPRLLRTIGAAAFPMRCVWPTNPIHGIKILVFNTQSRFHFLHQHGTRNEQPATSIRTRSRQWMTHEDTILPSTINLHKRASTHTHCKVGAVISRTAWRGYRPFRSDGPLLASHKAIEAVTGRMQQRDYRNEGNHVLRAWTGSFEDKTFFQGEKVA